MLTYYEFGEPREDKESPKGIKEYKHDTRDARWYIPVTQYRGIEVKELHPSVCPHFSTIHDALSARSLAAYNKPVKPLTCLRCDHKWEPRTPGRAAMCPRCKSRKWDIPRSENELGRKPKGAA